MSLIAWILLGLLSGFIAGKVVKDSGEDLWLYILLGVVGSIVGGGALHLVGQAGVSGFDFRSVLVSVFGAALALAVYHAVWGRHSHA